MQGTKKAAKKAAKKAVAAAKKAVAYVVRPFGDREPVEVPASRDEAATAASERRGADGTSLPGLRSKYRGTDLYLLPAHSPSEKHEEGPEPGRNPRTDATEIATHGGATLRCLRDVAYAIGGAGYNGPVPFELFAAYLAADPYAGTKVVGNKGIVRSTYRTQGIGRHLDCSIATYRQVAAVPAGTEPPESFRPKK